MKKSSATAVLLARAAPIAWRALRRGPRTSGLAFALASSLVDGLGAATAPLVYRAYGV